MSDVPFALIVAGPGGDRYFHAYEWQGKLVWDVFLWHPNLNCPLYEIKASMPVIHGGWEAGGGSIIYSSDGGDFDLRIAPNGEAVGTSIEVTTPGTTVRMDDTGLTTSGGLQANNNVVVGALAGFLIGSDGSFSMGVGPGAKPRGMEFVVAQ